MLNISIWPIDRTLTDDIIPGQSGNGSDGNEGVLRIPQSSNRKFNVVFRTLVVMGGRSYPSAEVQSVYSAAAAAWDK